MPLGPRLASPRIDRINKVKGHEYVAAKWWVRRAACSLYITGGVAQTGARLWSRSASRSPR
jgi:hypothetical protein